MVPSAAAAAVAANIGKLATPSGDTGEPAGALNEERPAAQTEDHGLPFPTLKTITLGASSDSTFPVPRLKPTEEERKLAAVSVPAVATTGHAAMQIVAVPAAPAELAPSRVAMSIDMNATRLAENIRLGFADERDFTGGAEALFTASTRDAPLPEAPKAENIVTIARGETLGEALSRANVRDADREAAIAALSEEMNVRQLKAGMTIEVKTAAPVQTVYQEVALMGRADAAPHEALTSLKLAIDDLSRIEVTRNAAGAFAAQTSVAETEKRYAAVAGVITDSLFASASRAGMPMEVSAKLSNMFLYDVDFQREIHYGDEFEAVYEVFYDEQGRAVAYGDVLYGRMTWRGGGKERGYYAYADGADDDLAWFDETGSSARRLLMKTPIEGARITSSFGMRKHPVLGYTKGHKGTDFGAARGTPIMAAGDGTVERANRFGSFGNYVKIKHAAGFQTAYAHLKGFGPGIKAGSRVRQGDIIGYVGTTGRSTGPHLHYEVLKDGTQVNPMTVKVADGRRLMDEDMAAFARERDWINAMRTTSAPLTLASR